MLIVGMFDDSRSLERGLSRLSSAGFDDEVERHEGPLGPSTPGGAGASEGGAQPVDLGRGVETSSPSPDSTRASARPAIGGNVLNREERDYYDRLLSEGGKLLLVTVPEERAEQVERMLSEAGAGRVARHVR